MKPGEELILKVAKEIVIKYIEIGRLPLTAFDEAFKGIYRTVKETVLSDPNAKEKGAPKERSQ